MFRSGKDQFLGDFKKGSTLTTEDANTPRNCEICDAMYFTETEVEVHKQTVHPHEVITNKILTCMVCTKVFKNEKQLAEHVKSFHLYSSPNATRVEQPLFVCDVCSKIFFLKPLLIIHLYTRHRIFNIHDRKTCPLCKRRVLLSSMWYHMETHCTKSVSSCHLCLKNLGDRAALMDHIKTHRGYYYCEMCSYVTTKCSNYHQHLANTHKPTKDQVDYTKVRLANFFIPDKRHVTGYKYRVQFVTSGLDLHCMMYICILCREICQTTKQMANHVQLHQSFKIEKKSDKKMCSCGEVFTNDILLKHHVFKLKGNHKKMQSMNEVNDRIGEQKHVPENSMQVEVGPSSGSSSQRVEFVVIQKDDGEVVIEQKIKAK